MNLERFLGRYVFLSAIANQLRYPNSHTHYFSCVLLYLFAESEQEAIKEQITRVLLERLIVNRPHPWGLLITFIELIKNPRYNFWNHAFTRCATDIERLFESVSRYYTALLHLDCLFANFLMTFVDPSTRYRTQKSDCIISNSIIM